MRTFRLAPPIVFDTDCLSSFLWVRRPDLLPAVLGGHLLVPEQVAEELGNLKPTRYAWVYQLLEQVLAAGGFQLLSIQAHGGVADEYLALTSGERGSQMGDGEAAALAHVRVSGGTVAGNSLSDVGRYCLTHGLELTGPDDILCLAVAGGRLGAEDAAAVWAEMRRRGRSLPACDFAEAYGRFLAEQP